MKDNAFGREEFEVAWNEEGLGIAFPCNLALAKACGGIDSPGDFACGDIFVSSDFGGNPLTVGGIDPDDFLKVAAVVSDPLACEGGLGRWFEGHDERK